MDECKMIAYGRYYADLSKGGIVYDVNDDFLKISGYSEDDFGDGKITLFDFLPEKYREEYIQIVQKGILQGNPLYLQHPFKRKNGTIIYVLCLGIPEPDSDVPIAKVIITDYTEHFELLSKYNSSQLELDALTSSVPGGVSIVTFENDRLKISKCNDEFLKMLNITDSTTELFCDLLLTSKEYNSLKRRFKLYLNTNNTFTYEFSTKLNGNNLRWFKLIAKMYKFSNTTPMFYTILFDITKEHKLNNQLLMQAEHLKIIADNTDEIYFDYDVLRDKLMLTNSLNRYGLDEDNTISNYWKDERPKEFIFPDDYNGFKEQWLKVLSTPQIGSFEFRTKAYDDDYTWYKMPYISVTNEENKVARVFGKMMSIQHIKSLKSKIDNDSEYINYLLETDNVTGLLNRKAFKKKVQKHMQLTNDDFVYAIVYSDINDFSYVNDNFGYEAGNHMLHDFGKVLTDIGTNILGCRIYSDYFLGLYKAKTRDELISSIEERNQTFTDLQKKKYPASDIHISCGIYFFTDKDTDVTIAIDNANLARRSVKSNKSVLCGIYSQRMRTQRTHEQKIASELHSAIVTRKIEMFLQPKFTMEKREIIGAEALARWKNEDGTYRMPYEFIPVLEKVGYIDELDFYIFEEVLRTLEEWKHNGSKVIPVSVNFSRHHINQMGFVDRIIDITKKYDVEPKFIEIEITESCFSGDMQSLFLDMERLRANGFKVDIDDFGIGYSTLSLLMNAPVDIVKIDKSFIDNLETNKLEREYLKNMCRLIDTVKKDIIFEGVETEGQAKILCDSGYTKAQGWLFDKAISIDEFNDKYMLKRTMNN